MQGRAHVARVEVQSKKFGCPSWPTGKDVITTSLVGQRSVTTAITTVDKQLQQFHRAGQRCFGLLVLISRPQEKVERNR